jgi:bifunctional UDP-N-acetylglucosamine pyrophosphorylase/glucosamine-1-phosphate N-acetyltransferase
VAGKPMLARVVETANYLSPSACHVVVGCGSQRVREELDQRELSWVEQTERLGTGHAVLQALPAVAQDSTVLVLYGDVPLITAQTLANLLDSASEGPALLTACLRDATGYGRVVRDAQGQFSRVVEHKDADADQLQLREVNTGVLAAPAALLKRWLPQVGNTNSQGEYYLPDILAMSVEQGVPVNTCVCDDELEVLGVNDRVQLNTVEREWQRREAHRQMREGVTLADAARLDVRGRLDCGKDVFIDANVVIEGEVRLGDFVTIGANCVLRDVSVGDGATIHPFSHLEEVNVGSDCSVGPFARLRPGTELGAGARVGNFVETKKALIGAGSKVNHLSYIGDCSMGERVNIGAGTITCNYDGVNKHKTIIGEGVFVGSNSTLVAPLEIAQNGFVGAGSTVTKNVERDQLAVGRGRQRNLDQWRRPG